MAEVITLSKNWAKNTKHKRILTIEEKEFLIRSYKRLSYRQMANHLNSSTTTVCFWCGELGLTTKPYTPKNRITEKDDSEFFDVMGCQERTWIV